MATNRYTPTTTFGTAVGTEALSNLDTEYANIKAALNDSSLGWSNYAGVDVRSANIYNVTLPYGVPSAYKPGDVPGF